MGKALNKKFSVGYNGQKDFFDEVVFPYRKYIASVYSAPPLMLNIPSARINPNVSSTELLELRNELKREKIDFNLVYNFDGISNPAIAVKLISTADFYKPDMITVNGIFTLDLFLQKTKYNLNISIINDINSLNQLDQLFEGKERKRVISYNIGRRKTFNLGYIRAVKKKYPKLRLKLMVNEGCVFECPDQGFHSCSRTMMRGKFRNSKIFYCDKFQREQYWRFLTGQYIPPKFLIEYLGLIDEFKLATRGASTENVVAIIEEYVNEKNITVERAMRSSHGGAGFSKVNFGEKERDLYAIPYPENFFKIRSSCRHNCYECDYCHKIKNVD